MKIKCPNCNTEFTKSFNMEDYYDSYKEFGQWTERKWKEIFNSNFNKGDEIRFVECIECPECENDLQVSMIFTYKDLEVKPVE